MPRDNVLTKEDFDILLMWFSPNREDAGAKYEEIRNGLIRFFQFKGCFEAENLADETINRVAKKLSTFDTDNNNKHVTYFYGFATKVFLEYRNRTQKTVVEFEQNVHSTTNNFNNEVEITENRHDCLDECLNKLLPEEKKMAIQYFSKEKSEKFEHRRKLAEQMSLSMGAMHVRIYRLKSVLRNCVENCLREK